MHHSRILRAALPALLLAGLVAAPASAAKPTPTANAAVSERSCEVLVSYAWSKFSGKNLTATVGLYERTDLGDQAIHVESAGGQVGRTGSISFVLVLTADVYPSGRTLVALGDLTDPKTGQQVTDSSAESPVISSTCG